LKFCVVGPVHPLRGGIAHHTTLLCRRLAEQHEVNAVTFKRLYPSFLFPGKSQMDTSKAAAEFPAEPVIDSLKPSTWSGASRLIRSWSPDRVLIQWWQPFFAPCLSRIASGSKPAKSIFICHNVLPHEANPLVKPLTLWALRHGDGFIVHSEKDRETLESLLPGRKVLKTVLPQFEVFPRQGTSKEEARRRLGVDGRVILFFGLVRKYKGLMDLIRAMALLKDMPVTCMVVGEFYSGKDRYLSEIERLGLGESIRVIDRYVPNEEVEPYFAAADVVVLPYRSATQSAIVQMAYRFERPVIATTAGGLPEVVEDGTTGLLVPPENPEALSRAIRKYYDSNVEPSMSAAVRGSKDRFSWNQVIEAIETLGASL